MDDDAKIYLGSIFNVIRTLKYQQYYYIIRELRRYIELGKEFIIILKKIEITLKRMEALLKRI
jgi:hypothetical protein